MKTLLVTGGAGFIGGNFVHLMLSDSDWRIVNLDKLTYAGNLDTLAAVMDHPRHVFVQGDIGDRDLIAQLLRDHQIDAVVNFAAESHVDRSIDGPAAFIETNVLGTFNLLDCTRAYWSALDDVRKAAFRFLHVSTDEVYGSLGDTGAFTETTPYAPNSPYSASKAASDHLVRAWHHTYGLPVLTTNCSNNYGPYQFPEKLIPLMIAKAIAGEPLPIYGDGSNVRDWLYVEDHCRAIARVSGGRPPWRGLQRRRQQREDQHGGRRHPLRVARRGAARFTVSPARATQTVRHRPPRSRQALRHRRHQAQARTGLGADRDLRERHAADPELVSQTIKTGHAASPTAATAASASAAMTADRT